LWKKGDRNIKDYKKTAVDKKGKWQQEENIIQRPLDFKIKFATEETR